MKNKTDKELFDLVIENNVARNNGVFDNYEKAMEQADKEVAPVLEELCKRGYLLTEEEFNAIDYYLTKSNLYDSGFWLCQEDWGEDYFHDDENEENLSLKEGLKVIYESFTDDIEEYPSEIKRGLKSALKRLLDIDLFIEKENK